MAAEKLGGVVPAEPNGQKGGVVPASDQTGTVVPAEAILYLSQSEDGAWRGTFDGKFALLTHDWGVVLRFAHDNQSTIATTPASEPVAAQRWCAKDKVDLYEKFLINLGESGSNGSGGQKGGVVPVANKKGTVVPA